MAARSPNPQDRRKQDAHHNKLALVLGSLLATGASADCGDDPTNLLSGSNCDFDTTTAGWTSASGQSFDATRSTGANGDPSVSGSLQTTAATTTSVVSDCVTAAVPAATDLNFGASILEPTGSGEETCSVTVSLYSTPDCSGAAADTLDTPLTGILNDPNAFTLVADMATTAGVTSTLDMTVTCNNGGASPQHNIDNAFISPTSSTPIDLMEFEVD